MKQKEIFMADAAQQVINMINAGAAFVIIFPTKDDNMQIGRIGVEAFEAAYLLEKASDIVSRIAGEYEEV